MATKTVTFISKSGKRTTITTDPSKRQIVSKRGAVDLRGTSSRNVALSNALAKERELQQQAEAEARKEAEAKAFGQQYSQVTGKSRTINDFGQNMTRAQPNMSFYEPPERLYTPAPLPSSKKEKKVTSRSAPTFRDREFFTVEGQKLALQRGAAGISQAGKKTVNTLTFGAFFSDTPDFTVNRDIVKSDRGARLLSLAANNPADTAFLAAGGFSAARGAGRAALSATGRRTAPTAAELLAKPLTRAERVIGGLRATKGGRLLIDTQLVAARGRVVGKGVSEGITQFSDKNLQSTFSDPRFSRAYSDTLSALANQNQGGEFGIPGTNRGISARQLAFNLNVGFGSKASFEKELRNQLRQEGFTGKRLDTAVKAGLRQRTATGFGEAASLLEIGRSGESIGRREISKQLSKVAGSDIPKKTAGKFLFKKSVFPLGRAGFVEGLTSVSVQDTLRGQEQNVKENFLGAGFGTVSASLIGGSIIGTSVNKGKTSKLINFGANIIDPFEKPGDITQEVFEFGLKKSNVFGKRVTGRKVVTVTEVPGLFTSSPTETLQVAGKKKGRAQSLINSIIPVNVNSRSQSNIPVLEDNFIFNDVLTQQETFVGTQTQQQTQTKTQQQTTTPVSNINTNINIPVVTPFPRFPPPLPLSLNLGGGSGGAGFGGRKDFFNELSAGLGLLGRATGTSRPKKKVVKKSSSSSKKRKSVKRRKR